MYSMKACPDCGAEHRLSIRRCGCGYTWETQKQNSQQMDPMHGCCEWTHLGKRCHYAGSWSDSTKGGGPWYCLEHSRNPDPEFGYKVILKSHEDVKSTNYSLEARRLNVGVK